GDVHGEAADAEVAAWHEIIGLYDALLRIEPSPVIALNRAVAQSMRDGAEVGLQRVEALLGDAALQRYHLAWATHADLCRRLGHAAQARASYQRALELARLPTERRFLERRIEEMALPRSIAAASGG